MFNMSTSLEWLGSGSITPATHGGGDGGGGDGLIGFLDSILDVISHGLESDSSWRPMAGIEALGSNIHPYIVHFPIAFLTGFLLLEMIGLGLRSNAARQIASGMLYLGAVSAVIAAGAGLIAGENVPHGAAVHQILEWHERLGLTVATLSVVLALWRAAVGTQFSTMAQALHLIVAGIVGACLFFAADLGGLMVYQYGVGVKNLQYANDHHTVEHSHDHHGKDDETKNEEAPTPPDLLMKSAE
jgi:uncharacterized membrane protein